MHGRHRFTIGLFVTLAITTLFGPGLRFAAAEEDQDRWPMVVTAEEGTIYIYEPQIESFEADHLTARAAVSFTPKGTENPVFGAAWFKARLHTDRETRIAVLEDVEVTDARFPDATPEHIKRFSAIVRAEFLKSDIRMSLDELLAGLELAEKEKLAGANLKNDPPKIHYREHPALLVQVDGEPQLLPIEGTAIMKVANTPFYILYDGKAAAYYLSGAGSWLTTKEFTGKWESVANLPKTVADVAAKDPAAPKIEEGESSLSSLPEIVVATEPAEMLQTDGPAKYTPIDGTMLLRVSNTENDIMMEIASQEFFVLLSGRWFKTKSLSDGPFAYVDPANLPEDFRKIPDSDEAARIRSSVPGTIEAKEAVMDTYIPQTASIDRKEATLAVSYDGDPQFEPVEETSIKYAVNTSFSVFLVNGLYYCCNDAVWFVGPSANGPWEVATEVPAEIYTIPPSNPHYNTTYVHVYQSTPSVVYVGYYPGYMGCYPYRGVVVWGTGWWYRPWYRHHYYPRPATFGFGVRYNPWTGGWGVGIGFRGPMGGWVGIGYGGGGAWLAGGIGRAAWWGGGGFRRNDININIDRSVNIKNSFNRNQIGNNRIGNTNRNLYKDRKGVDRTRDNRRDKRPGGGRDRPGTADRTRPAAGTRDRKNNVYADKNGNVYRRDNNGWQKRDGNKWKDTTSRDRAAPARPATTDRRPGDRSKAGDRRPSTRPSTGNRPSTSNRSSSSGFNRGGMERSHQSRQRSASRSSSASRSNSAGSRSRSSGSRSGGGSRGGGRR